jgi:phosphatidylglycerol:prolipoprotein diacylglycerol transferase
MKIPVVLWSGRSFNLVNFGLFAAIGAMLGYSINFFYLYTRGIQVNQFCWEFVSILIFFNLFFAKFYSIYSIGLTNYFRNFRSYLNETSFYQQGGIIGFILGTLLVHFLLDIPLVTLGDAVCMGGIATMSIGRLGCSYYGCCTGKPMNGRFGIIYTDPNAKICRDYPELMNTPLIPVQLISSAVDFVIFLICCLISTNYPYSGLVMIIFFFCVNLKRIVIQNFRFKPTTNKIPYQLVAFTLIISFVLIISIFHYNGELIFEPTPVTVPFTLSNYFLFLFTNLKIMASIFFVGLINFAAYGIHGRRIGTHFNLSA